MIIGLIVGFIIGFVLSMPPLGPTTFSIIARGFKNEEKEGIAIGVGAAFMDFIYILAAYGGVSIIKTLLPHTVDIFFDTNEKTLKVILTLLGCFVVVFYGFKLMKMKIFKGNNSTAPLTEDKIEEVVMEKAETKLLKTEKELDRILHTQKLEKGLSGLTGEFLTGILLCLSSVTLPASWFAIVSYLKSYGVIDSKFLSGLALAVGVFIGTAVWFYVIVKFVSKNSHRINPRMLNKINISVGVILILLGVFLLIKAVDFIFL
ncbi:MAG: LysE family transporter [Ignavibacteriae bacterium]|nr:LysE family transporter [Ignavibacteriota bacterium]